MSTLDEINQLVLQWADDRGITKYASSKIQSLKLVSEVGELCDNIAKDRNPIDDIGDCMVVLSIIAELEGLTLQECFNHAYNDIKDRKGHMTSEGLFIKEGDTDEKTSNN